MKNFSPYAQKKMGELGEDTQNVSPRKLRSIPATITILDSEGYITARPRRESPISKTSLQPLIRVLDTFADTTTQSSQHNITCASRKAHASVDADDALNKLEGFARELKLKNDELHKLKHLVESYGSEMNKLRRNHAYELRLLQKALLNLRTRKKGHSDPSLEITERLTKTIKERDVNAARCQQLEEELQEARALHCALARRLDEKDCSISSLNSSPSREEPSRPA